MLGPVGARTPSPHPGIRGHVGHVLWKKPDAVFQLQTQLLSFYSLAEWSWVSHLASLSLASSLTQPWGIGSTHQRLRGPSWAQWSLCTSSKMEKGVGRGVREGIAGSRLRSSFQRGSISKEREGEKEGKKGVPIVLVHLKRPQAL